MIKIMKINESTLSLLAPLLIFASCAKPTLAPDQPSPPLAPSSLIESKMLEQRDEFRKCYKLGLSNSSDEASGDIMTYFEVGSEGQVLLAQIKSTTLKNPKTENCILEVIKKIRFPSHPGVAKTQVSYPFKLKLKKELVPADQSQSVQAK